MRSPNDPATQGSVLLTAKQHVKRYENVGLNCSSDTIPLGKTANLEVNGKSFTAITLLSTGECFSSILRNQCTPDVCACSSRGLWFSHIYDVVQHVGRINITCSMILKEHGSSSDSVQVNVIDFTGPTLSTDPELPFRADIKAYFIFIMNDINMNHDGNICRCCINVDGITAKSEISVSIISTPIIQSTEIVTCNSSAVNLSCIIKTGLPSYGFNLWTHSVKCYQEAGEYTCNAWNTHGETSLVVNKNISLQVNTSPVIISMAVFPGRKTTLSASIYSSTEIIPVWQQLNETIVNSTDLMQTLERRNIKISVYNKSIECHGYVANLSISSSLNVEYVLFVRNAFGETKLFFDTDELITQDLDSTASFDLRVLIFSIVALGIFIFTATGAVIMSKGTKHPHVIHIIGPHERCPSIPIYHSAPASGNTPNVYDLPNPGYLEVIDDASSYISTNHYAEID
ncbi:TTN [Mytilus edulis]|uniref:TTN n=1 Tax=Mytilus edulis TaxID=6550 RepID=A0A8S3T9J7_MYTED|nr:TTN [Mytilus edulis]